LTAPPDSVSCNEAYTEVVRAGPWMIRYEKDFGGKSEDLFTER